MIDDKEGCAEPDDAEICELSDLETDEATELALLSENEPELECVEAEALEDHALDIPDDEPEDEPDAEPDDSPDEDSRDRAKCKWPISTA
jgi:hypothetical protein